MSIYNKSASKPTPQSKPLRGREAEQSKNAAGGYTFLLDPLGRLRRFLIIGTEKGTFYQSEADLTEEGIGACEAAVKHDGAASVELIRHVSKERLAAKRSPTMFALAVAAKLGDDATRSAAYDAVAEVCGTPTDLFDWLECVKALGGFGSGVQRAIRLWYAARDPSRLAYQMSKYRNREGWTHADALRIAHPPMSESEHGQLFAWATWYADKKRKDGTPVERPAIFYAAECAADSWAAPVWAYERAQTVGEVELIRLIETHNLPRECIPTEHLKSPGVWGALLRRMPMTAMLRNLGNFGKHGLLTPFSDGEKSVLASLEGEAFDKAKPHPVQILLALGQYMSGHGQKGSGSWTPNPRIGEALGAATKRAFRHATPTGKRVVVAIDLSCSMSAACSSAPALPCWGVAKVLGDAFKTIEKNVLLLGFGERCTTLDVSQIVGPTFGGTDCSRPFSYCMNSKIEADLFVLFTDNETWAGSVHPCDALDKYRKKINENAKAVSVAMTATKGSIADPKSAAWLSVVGLDASFPQLVQEWAR